MKKPDFKRLAFFLGLNFLLSLLIGTAYLFFAGSHPLELAFVSVALVSNTVMLYAALALPAVLLFLTAPGRWLLWGALGFFQLALFTDACVYKIFKFHLNSMVFNLVTTPGGLDSLEQGWGMKAFLVFVAASMFARLLCFVLADKGLFAWGTLYDSVYITRNFQLFPLYQPLRTLSFVAKYLGVKLDSEVKAGIDVKYSCLDYPRAPHAGIYD